MAMSKIERIDKEIQKTREKITEYQNRLRGLEAQRLKCFSINVIFLFSSSEYISCLQSVSDIKSQKYSKSLSQFILPLFCAS